MAAKHILCAALFAGVALGGISPGGIPDAKAHSVKQCQKQVKGYKSLCKFSPTALIMGMCVTKKTYQWCSDKKKHDEKFHK